MIDENINKEQSLQDKLTEISNIQKEKEIEKNLLLTKALNSSNPKDILFANNVYAQQKSAANPFQAKKIKSYLFDPYSVNESLGYKNSAKGMSYNILRGMAKSPIVKAIITTRVEQVASFSNPQEDQNKTGWTIRKKKGIFLHKDEETSTQERYEMEGIAEFLLNAGTDKNKWHADSFDTFLRKIVPDSLTLDQMTFEVVANRFGKPNEFFATDGATFRLATSFNNEKPTDEQTMINGYYPSYVQLYQGLVNSEFYPWEMCFGIRNLSKSIENNGYGNSELEDMVKMVTWMLYADTYNGKFFSQGAAPKGLLKISGIQDEDKLDEFRQQWKSQVAGVENAWKTPVVNADNVDWVDLQISNQDMQFTAWQEYLIRLACAQFKIDPTEIGFYLSGSQGGTTYEGNGEYKQKFSKDKGLYPLLRFIQTKINRMIIGPLTNNKYEFAFTGIEENLEDISLENDIKKLGAGIISWTEVRAKYNLPPTIKKDDFLLSSTWIQLQQMKQGQGNQQSNDWVDGQNGDTNENPFTLNQDNQTDEEANPFMKQLSGLGGDSNNSSNPFNGGSKKENPFSKGINPFMDDFMGFVDKLNNEGK